jgi:uncharacterized protein (TIGR02118 family)
MIGRLGMAPRIEALSLAEFQHHWRTSHADAVAALPGLRTYIQFHAVLDDQGQLRSPYPGFDACSLLVFDSIDQMDDAFVSPQFTSAVVADENEFVDKSDFCGMLGDWQASGSRAVSRNVLLMELWREAPQGSFDATLTGKPQWHEGRYRQAAEVVTWRSFASADEAVAAATASRENAALISQHVCEPIVVLASDTHPEGRDA